MIERVIPPHLMDKIDALASNAWKLKEIAAKTIVQVEEILQLGRAEGFADSEIRELILQGLKNRGFSDRSSRRYLPDSLKDQRRAEGGRKGNEAKKQKQQEQPTAIETDIGVIHPENLTQSEERKTVADIVTPKSETVEFGYYEGKIKALQQKVQELQSELESRPKEGQDIVVKVTPKLYAKLFSSLRTNIAYVKLTADYKTSEVYGVEAVRQ